MRRRSQEEVPQFIPFSLLPLADDQMREILDALGIGPTNVRFPDQVADLGRWPMWALALIVYGPESKTGLEIARSSC